MKILMLGNSLTTANDMPQRLAELLSAEVVVHARGGARLAEQLNADTRMGARTGQILQEEQFDYVVLQEMSHGPATAQDRYLESVRRLTRMIREADAEPVLYATWAFRSGCDQLEKIGMDASSMHERMQETFRQAVKENDIIMIEDNMLFHGMEIDNLPKCYDMQLLFDDQITQEDRSFALSYAMWKFEIKPQRSHDALNDAINTVEVLKRLDLSEGFEDYEI